MKLKQKICEIYHKVSAILIKYCLNCSITGIGYIANSKYHISERIFWLICLIFSSFGSYHLIYEYIEAFESQAISLVIENLQPQEKSIFPAIGICEEYNDRVNAPKGSELFAEIKKKENLTTSFDDDDAIEEFLIKLAFPNILHGDVVYRTCYGNNKAPYCPKNNFTFLMDQIPAKCTELFEKCKWNTKEFNCCDYFYYLKTTMGKCFLLNSIQTKAKGKKNTLDLIVGLDLEDALLELKLKRDFFVHLLNEEDVPESSINFLKYAVRGRTLLKLSLANIINDEGVRDIDPEYRGCRFPDENISDAIYKYYSFPACVSACFKRAQLLFCNCTAYQYANEDDSSESLCDLDGLICLEKQGLTNPTPKRILPWIEATLNCSCLPSCTENEILLIENTQIGSGHHLNISLINLPYERYRRQAVRGKLDIVVSIGGILGLFLGVSIISGIELIYYIITGVYQHFIK